MKLNLNDFFLDTKKLFELDTQNVHIIYELYNKLLDSSLISMPASSIHSIFNTLVKGGYLVNKSIEERDEKLGGLING